MKKVVLAIALMFATPVQAVELTVQQCIDIYNGLSTLDKYEKDGKQVSYRLNMETRIAIARNLTMLRDIKTAFEQTNYELLMRVTDGKGRFDTVKNPQNGQMEPTPEAQEKIAHFNVENHKIVLTKQDVKFARIKTRDLLCGPDDPECKDPNPISPMTLSTLGVILED